MALSEKLYREHFSKTSRMNQQKIENSKEESKGFRNRPLINEVSRDIFQLVSEKNRWDGEVLERFGRYELERAQVRKDREQAYRDKYYPFQPSISETSRAISRNKGRLEEHNHHCQSCSVLKQKMSHHSPLPYERSSSKGNQSRQRTVSAFMEH